MLIDSGFFRRLKFYVFGFLIGALAVNIIFKGRACRLPGTLKLEELQSQTLQYTEHAQCRMQCRKISEEEVRQLLKEGKINYGKSNVHDVPCATYAIEGATKIHAKVRVIIADCDSVSKVVTTIDLTSEKDSCNCN